jgi:hypothetical protein
MHWLRLLLHLLLSPLSAWIVLLHCICFVDSGGKNGFPVDQSSRARICLLSN